MQDFMQYEYERNRRQLVDAYAEIDKHKASIKKLNRFIIERGLGDEYIAWIIAERITTGEE